MLSMIFSRFILQRNGSCVCDEHSDYTLHPLHGPSSRRQPEPSTPERRNHEVLTNDRQTQLLPIPSGADPQCRERLATEYSIQSLVGAEEISVDIKCILLSSYECAFCCAQLLYEGVK